MLVRELNAAAITGNHMFKRAAKQLVADLGDHPDPDQVVIAQKPCVMHGATA